MSSNKSKLNKYSKDLQKGYQYYNSARLFSHFSLLAKNRFKWTNLPNTIKSHHIEKVLYEKGEVGFYLDDEKGFVALPISPIGCCNVYGEHVKYMINGIGYNKTVDIDEMVKIKCNDDSSPTMLQVAYYCDLIDDIENTMFFNLNQQKLPYIVPTTKTNELTMKNILKKLETGEPVIYVDERLAQGGDVGVRVIKTDAPYLLDKLHAIKQDTYNELYSFLGINNTNTNKKERLLVDEVNVNNNHILMNLELEYKHRQEAAKEINEKYGLNIQVEKTIECLEVDFIGNLHTGTTKTIEG